MVFGNHLICIIRLKSVMIIDDSFLKEWWVEPSGYFVALSLYPPYYKKPSRFNGVVYSIGKC